MQERGWSEEEINTKLEDMTTKDGKRYYKMKWVKKGEYAYFKPHRYDYLPEIVRYYAAMDLALGETKKGSYLAIVVLGQDINGQVYEIDSIIEQSSPDRMMEKAFNLPYKFERFGIETVGFQKYYLNRIQERSKELGKYIPFEAVKQSKSKQVRIESLEPFVNTGQILFCGDSILHEELVDYPDGDHVDGIDALEMAWRYFVKKKDFFYEAL